MDMFLIIFSATHFYSITSSGTNHHWLLSQLLFFVRTMIQLCNSSIDFFFPTLGFYNTVYPDIISEH